MAFEKYTLPNGLQVILHVDRKLPIVHVNQWYHVGSKNEQKGRTGFAHLFEHMMFQGSKNASEEYFTYVERAGANLQEGGVNGTTSSDRTNYFATVPSGNLENILWLESDRLATLLDATDIKKLDNQRDVVKNERRQGLENQPYGRWYPLALEAVFPTGHPYSWPVIGSQEDLTAASLTDVKEFFRRYYTPNNLSLVIAGDFDPAEAKRLVEKYFGAIPPGPALDRPARWVPVMNGEKIVEVNDRVPQERTYMAWPAPAYFTEDEAALNLATLILTDGLSSRLNKALVYDKQLCSAVSVVPDHHGDRRRVHRAGHRPSGRHASADRSDHHRRNRAAREDRPDRRGARTRQDEVGIRVRVRPGSDRRIRRQGGSAQSVQHLPRRSRQVRRRPRASPPRQRRATCAPPSTSI